MYDYSAGHKSRQAQGQVMTRPDRVPFGTRVGPAGSLEPDPDEQAAIEAVLDNHAEGLSYRKIAMAMNQAGVPCRKALCWHYSTVRSIILRASST